MIKAWLSGVLTLGTILGAQAAAEPVLPPIFTDHMVIQRGEAIPVWGTATPGAEVTISLGEGAGREITADEDGKFWAELPAQTAGGPYRLTVTEGRQKVALEDVMIGDVFLCSGQSNMEFPVSRALNAGREVAVANDPLIRAFYVPKAAESAPKSEMDGTPVWNLTTPETVGDFSAVCYFTARDLRPHLPEGLPIGLVQSYWGGSQIEAWIPTAQLAELGDNAEDLALLAEYNEDPKSAQLGLGKTVDRWWRGALPDGPVPYDPENESTPWQAAPAGMGDYNVWPEAGLAGFTGLIWYRGEVTLTAAQAEQDATLVLGPADDVDYTWVDGTFVGSTFGWGDIRTYDVPASTLSEGDNVIVSGVYNSWGAGGLSGPEDEISLRFADGSSAPVKAGFEYWVSPGEASVPPRGPWESVSGLTTLYNGMIAPLGPIKLKAALWYQGESNTGRAGLYGKQLLALGESWREQFGDDLPLIVAQLPNFGAISSGSEDSGWSRLREEQRQAALSDPLTELVVLIDAGDRWDIHPPNKQVVGQRMAETIRESVYGQDVVAGGPVPKSIEQRRRRTLSVKFDRVGDGMMAAGGLAGPFHLCMGTECTPAIATLKDEKTVDITVPASAEFDRVHYCWGDAPVCTLFGKDGEPVGPFEMMVE